MLTPATVNAATAAGLAGSPASMRRQHKVAKKNNYTFLRTARQVREFIRNERLVRLQGNADYSVKAISFPYARDAVKLFVERIARQYHEATGDRLVVTSLTRPVSRQPRNASPLSVHPTGMAVDFRMPKKASHRRWLERTLLSLEDMNVLDATRERRPAHYHVAVFPREYLRYVASRGSAAVAFPAGGGTGPTNFAETSSRSPEMIANVIANGAWR
jgi:hypothetical protein